MSSSLSLPINATPWFTPVIQPVRQTGKSQLFPGVARSSSKLARNARFGALEGVNPPFLRGGATSSPIHVSVVKRLFEMSAAANSAPSNSGFFTKGLQDADPQVFKSIQDELNRQRDKIELIASENIVSKAVLESQGSVLTNKYAEGYPGKRYYGGCEYVDVAEQLAIERAKKLFAAGFANVQA